MALLSVQGVNPSAAIVASIPPSWTLNSSKSCLGRGVLSQHRKVMNTILLFIKKKIQEAYIEGCLRSLKYFSTFLLETEGISYFSIAVIKHHDEATNRRAGFL